MKKFLLVLVLFLSLSAVNVNAATIADCKDKKSDEVLGCLNEIEKEMLVTLCKKEVKSCYEYAKPAKARAACKKKEKTCDINRPASEISVSIMGRTRVAARIGGAQIAAGMIAEMQSMPNKDLFFNVDFGGQRGKGTLDAKGKVQSALSPITFLV